MLQKIKKYLSFLLGICIFGSSFVFSFAYEVKPNRAYITDINLEKNITDTLKGNFVLDNNTNNNYSELYINIELFLTQPDTSDSIRIDNFTQKESINNFQKKTIAFNNKLRSNLFKGQYFILINVEDRTGNSICYEKFDTGQIGSDIDFLISSDPYYLKDTKKLYSLSGPSFNAGDSPKLFVTFVNPTSKTITASAVIAVYQRTLNYTGVPVDQATGNSISFAPQEKKQITIDLPSIKAPESYLAQIIMKNSENKTISGIVEARYVIRGLSGKITDCRIDNKDGKLFYKATLTGPPDGTPVENATFKLKITDVKKNISVFNTEGKVNIGIDIKNMEIEIASLEEKVELSIVAELSYSDKILDTVKQTYTIDGNDSFIDISKSSYRKEINDLAKLNIIKGYNDKTFKPLNKITRAEFTVILTNITGSQDLVGKYNNNSNFTDVNNKNWAAKYINIAFQKGLIKGYENKKFAPANNIKITEAVTILINWLEGTKMLNKDSKWPQNYLNRAEELKLFSGLEIKNKNDFATREQIVKLALTSIKYKASIQK